MLPPHDTLSYRALGFICALGAVLAGPAGLLAQSVQSIYRDGVPHTDKNGNILTQYDPAQSFFQIGTWGAPPAINDMGTFYDWQILKDADFNTAWTYYKPFQPTLDSAAAYDMQAVVCGMQLSQYVQAYHDHPNLLGLQLIDEPLTRWWHEGEAALQQGYDDFLLYKNAIQQTMGIDMPIFVNSTHLIQQPYRDWWLQFQQASDISCHDNYPFYPGTNTLASEPSGVAQSVGYSVTAHNSQKPVWHIVAAFQGEPGTGRIFPTRDQLRAQVYTAIVHGATGIVYFIWDSYVSRAGNVVGIHPDPVKQGYTDPQYNVWEREATDQELIQSVDLWEETTIINSQLVELGPALLSATVSPDELSYNLSHTASPYTTHPIRTILKPDPQNPGQYLLITVNTDNGHIDASFDFSAAFEQIELLYDDAGSQLDNVIGQDGFDFHYDPWAARVFRFSVVEPILGDIDGNGVLDSLDIDRLFDLIGSGQAGTEYDFDASGTVDKFDVQYLVEQIMGKLMGDANFDGTVDEADLAFLADGWKLHLGEDLYTWATGDFTGNGYINEGDLAYLADMWRQVGSGGQTAVPEPFSAVILAGLAGALCPRSFGRR